MAKRKIINIDQDKCTGCGLCVPDCPEGAIQIIDNKARLVSDIFCDGLGACIGQCPEGAISVVEREAEAYDETMVMEKIIEAGPNTIKAHLKHLYEHSETGYLSQALDVLKDRGLEVPEYKQETKSGCFACPGSAQKDIKVEGRVSSEDHEVSSQLRGWPVQLHLASPGASQFKGCDLLLAADCTAYAFGNFHQQLLNGKSLLIACPKLDTGQDRYEQKLTALIDQAKINTLTVVRMEVPCCGGLRQLVLSAMQQAQRKVPLKEIIISIDGKLLKEEWI